MWLGNKYTCGGSGVNVTLPPTFMRSASEPGLVLTPSIPLWKRGRKNCSGAIPIAPNETQYVRGGG